MMLVGDVKDRTAILIDDLADTSNTITRAAKLLKREGAARVYALVTHGILSGDAIDRINASALDKVVVTNSVDQADHLRRCPKLEVLEVGHVFAEVIYLSRCLMYKELISFYRPSVAFTTARVSAFSSSTTNGYAVTGFLLCFIYSISSFLCVTSIQSKS